MRKTLAFRDLRLSRLGSLRSGPPPVATAPSAFTAGQWDATDAATGGTISVTISSLPAANGSAITDIERKVGAGAWTSTGGTGAFSITGLSDGTPVDLQIRAVNAIGAGPASDTKTRTPTAGAVITISNLAINTAADPDEITLDADGEGTLYWVVTAAATTPSAAQIQAGQTHTGAAGSASGSFAIVFGANTGTPDLTGLAVGTWYLHCVLVGTVTSNTLTSASFEIVASFTAAWQQFDGAAWLEKATDLTGIPTNSAGVTVAMTYSPSATDIGQARELFVGVSSVNRLMSLTKASTNGIDARIENSSDVSTWILAATGTAMVAGGKYLLLVAVDPAGAGGKARVFRLDTGGGQTISVNDTDTGTLGGPSSSGWIIAAASGTGTRATSGQIERIQFWANTYADVGDSTVQGLFHTAGVLRDPAIAIASIGTPHISIVGAALQTGANSGSGGNFTKDGAGSIVAA